ncbi:hypothetical protein Tco_0452900 [Tanacetum coccineum]
MKQALDDPQSWGLPSAEDKKVHMTFLFAWLINHLRQDMQSQRNTPRHLQKLSCQRFDPLSCNSTITATATATLSIVASRRFAPVHTWYLNSSDRTSRSKIYVVNIVVIKIVDSQNLLDFIVPDELVSGAEVSSSIRRRGIVVDEMEASEKIKRKEIANDANDPLPAKGRLRTAHPILSFWRLWRIPCNYRLRAVPFPEAPITLGRFSSRGDIPPHVTVTSSRVADPPLSTTALIFCDFNREQTLVDRVAPPGFFSTLRNMDYDQLFMEFNVGAARHICLGSEVRSRAEHELELKEKLRAKYDARGVLLSEKDAEIARLKSLLKEKETESAEVLRLRDQVSVLAAEKSSLSAEVSALKSDVSQKDTVISLLDSRASHLKSSLDDSQAACDEAKNLISSLSSEKDGLVSEVSTLHSAFRDFKEKMEAQQEEQAHELYNRVAELEAHVMDVSGRLEGEFYPAYLTALAGRRWLLTHGMELAMVKCLKSPEYQGILGHALGRAVDYGMQEGLAAGYEHGIAGTPLSTVVAYDPETAKNNYFDAVGALEEVDFPLIHLLKSKKDSGMDEVLDCFLLDGPLANLPEAAYLQPCLEQLSVPIYYADVNAVVGETSLSFALLNVHNRAEGARKHAAALRRLMMDIVSHPLSSQNLLGEASTSAVAFCVDDLDTDEDLGSVVCMPHLEDPRFEIFP